VEERRRVGGRISAARRESGLTQRELAHLLGVTVRSVQNYESGAVVPYKHLRRIEMSTGRRPGWLLDGDDGGPLVSSIDALHTAMERHRVLMQDHLRIMRIHADRLRESREASERRRSRAEG
jgi:transcriptional regulator with XRE-family HTH domain